MKNLYLFLFIGMLGMGSLSLDAQSFYFGLKGGLTIGTQKWDNTFERDPLFRYHFAAFTESYTEDDTYNLYAQLGYNVKGSAIRTYGFTAIFPDGSERYIPPRTTPFEFRNIGLTLGGKQKFSVGEQSRVFYLLGIRGEYTVSTKLRPDGIEESDNYYGIYPFDEYVNKFTFGVTAGAGFQFMFSELVGATLEFTANPDFTNQYNQPEIRNVINPNPNYGSNNITIPERQIKNTTFEVTLGLRFLRKVIYVD